MRRDNRENPSRIPALTGRRYEIEPFDFDASADEWASKPGGPIPEWLRLDGDEEFSQASESGLTA